MYTHYMNKSQFTEELRKREAELSGLIALLKKRPEMTVDGNLVCASRRERLDYYDKQDANTATYLGADRHELIVKLAQKKYYGKLLVAAEKEKEQIGKCLQTLKSGSSVDDVYPSLHKGIRKLVSPMDITDDGYVAKWLKLYSSFSRGGGKKDDALRTMNGEYVRSKSEVIIADRLAYAGIPYVYEPPLSLETEYSVDMYFKRYPDFIVLNKRTRAEYYWEHLGMLDKGKYCVGSQLKMEAYARKGYFPGKNLLITFESGDRPLSTEYVDSLVREYLS